MNPAVFKALSLAINVATGIPTVLEALKGIVDAFKQDRAMTPEQEAALDARMEAAFAGEAWQPDATS